MRSGLCLAALLLAFAVTAQATVIHVPGDFSIIQDAVDAAGTGDTVLVGAGTYTEIHHPPGADTTQCVVSMKPDIYLIGAGQGQAIIDVQDLGRGIYCHTVADAHIEGFTIKRAFAEVFGAGIYCTQGSSPFITDCEITDCGDGGIICNFGSSPEITYCDITLCEGKQGGAIAIENNSSPTVRHCTITENAAPLGGGMYLRTGTILIENCTISNNSLNTTNGSGGGIAIASSAVTIRNCEINGNASTGTGGGIDLIDEAEVIIEDSTIQNNTTEGDNPLGCGIYCEFSDLTLRRCTITGNNSTAATSNGGGLYAFFTDAGNPILIEECTIADNSVTLLGGGISCAFASPTLSKSIIAFNSGRGMECDASSVPDVSCTDIYGNPGGDDICGNDLGANFSQDPRFCDMPSEDYTLHVDSPCLDNQHPAAAPCGPIGAHGLGTCDGIGVPDEGQALTPPMRHFASPNPFGPSTTIHFGLHTAGTVRLAIFDVHGRQVRLLESRTLAAGEHQREWDARDQAGQPVPNGVYFYQLGGTLPSQTGRLVLAR